MSTYFAMSERKKNGKSIGVEKCTARTCGKNITQKNLDLSAEPAESDLGQCISRYGQGTHFHARTQQERTSLQHAPREDAEPWKAAATHTLSRHKIQSGSRFADAFIGWPSALLLTPKSDCDVGREEHSIVRPSKGPPFVFLYSVLCIFLLLFVS